MMKSAFKLEDIGMTPIMLLDDSDGKYKPAVLNGLVGINNIYKITVKTSDPNRQECKSNLTADKVAGVILEHINQGNNFSYFVAKCAEERRVS